MANITNVSISLRPFERPFGLYGRDDAAVVMRPVLTPAPGSRFKLLPAALLCTALAATSAIWRGDRQCCPWDYGGRPELRELIAAAGARRPIEGRLTGGFAYHPAEPAPNLSGSHARSEARPDARLATQSAPLSTQRGSRDASASLSPAIQIAIARIEERYLASDDPINEAALGTAKLVAGNIDAGLDLFDSVLTRAGERAEVWSDASAAYLAAAGRLERDELWVQALEAAERARQLRPALAEALFNRALALEGIGLGEQARRAWQDYLAADATSAWAEEARRHEQALASRITTSAAWDSERRELDARLTHGQWRAKDNARVMRFRQHLRIWIERELIPRWATALLAQDAATARTALLHAQAAADLLQRIGGDPMPAMGVARIAALEDRDPQPANANAANREDARAITEALARAHLELPKIARLWDESAGGATGAAQAFATIHPAFVAARSPYAEWNAMYAALSAYMSRDLRRVLEVLDASEPRVPAASYLGSIRGWLRGLIALNENRLSDARTAYEEALHTARGLGESDTIAALSALLAENYAALGDSRQAWRYQRLGLEHVPQMTVPRRKHLILQIGGLLCFSDDAPRAALEFQDAVIGVSRASDRVSSLTEGYLHRARTEALIDRLPDARADLERARALLPRIQAEDLRRRVTAEVDAAAAEVLSKVAPDSAIEAASRALTHFGETGTEFRLSRLHLLRGRVYLAQNQHDRAEQDFTAAIDRFEALRDRVLDRRSRITVFQDGWNAFAEMVDLTVRHRRNPEAALELAERARARTLLEAMAGPAAKPETARAIAGHLPADTAVLFYVSHTDRLLLWVVTPKGITFLERRVPRHELRFAVARVQRLLSTQTRGAHAAADRLLLNTLRALHADLIAPARDAIGGAATLVIVPDGPLHALPFAALVDASTDRHLVERYVIGIAPSLTTFRRASAGDTAHDRARALLVGDPKLPAGPGGYAPLPFARDEVRVLADVYPGARMLVAAAATRQAFFTHLTEADVVHYAGHAVVDAQEPDRSRLMLAGENAAMDGALFVHELRASTLPRRPLVVLAACSTNRGRIATGEGVQSLARPFLEAGARSVIATLWDVDDRLSTELFRRFHHHVAAGASSARALAQTQRELLASRDSQLRARRNWAWAVAIGGSVQ